MYAILTKKWHSVLMSKETTSSKHHPQFTEKPTKLKITQIPVNYLLVSLELTKF